TSVAFPPSVTEYDKSCPDLLDSITTLDSRKSIGTHLIVQGSQTAQQTFTDLFERSGVKIHRTAPVGCTVKHMLVDLDTRGEGAGLVIRGGWTRAASHIRPLTVMRIRENSMADLDGRIKPGDRILAINNVQAGRLSCEEAIKHIELSKNRLNLVVEYNVANFELDRNVSGAVMVEIEKPGNEDLGISLAPCHEVKTGQNAFFINYLRQGSIADRCGALFTGDRVEAIDDIHVEDLTLQEAMRRLKHNGLDRVRLQIVPNAICDPERLSKPSTASLPSLMTSRPELCRSEEVEVCLEPDESLGYGFTLCAAGQSSLQDSQLIRFPVVDRVDIGGSAYKSGVIQEGDRVITINGLSTLNRTVEELTNEFLTPEAAQTRLSLRLTLVTQYSVADTVVPSSGVFDVKLVRRAANLGINLQASIKKQEGQPLLISKVIPGSVASRSGSINPGDILLAVNGVALSSCTLSEAIRLLQSPTEEIVTLRVQKIGASPPSPRSENLLVRSSPDASTLFTRAIRYRRSDSVPESELTKSFSIHCRDLILKHKCEKESHSHEKESEESNISQRLKSGRSRAPLIYRAEQVATDPSTSSGQDEIQTPTVKTVTRSRPISSSNEQSGKKPLDECSKTKEPQTNIDEIRRRLLSSPEELSQDEGISIVRVVLKRKSADCPWGITICGTDEATNAPVFVDSLNPGDPGATSGLLYPGDRILAINGSALNSGHTLTQAMRMLQRYPDRVILHLARPNRPQQIGSNDEGNGAVDVSEDRLEAKRETKSDLTRKISLKKVVAMSNFSRSFDSMTNSVGSGTALIKASEVLPTSVTTPGIPLGLEGTRPKSSTSVRAVPQGDVGKSENATTRLRTYSGAETGIALQRQFGESNGRSKSHEHFRKLDTQSRQSVTKLSPRPSAKSTGVCHSESQNFGEWMCTEPGDGLSFESETNEEDGTAYVLDHPEFYPTYTDYSEIDLFNIQCPGCREAIINELRQQRIQSRLRGRRHGEQFSQHHLRRRPQSQQRSAPPSNLDSTSGQSRRSVDLQTKPSEATTADPPKATFFCPEQELNIKAGPPYWYASDIVPITRHSKSDSRINLAGNSEVATEQPSTTIPTPKPARMRLKPTAIDVRAAEKQVPSQHRHPGSRPKSSGRQSIPSDQYDRGSMAEEIRQANRMILKLVKWYQNKQFKGGKVTNTSNEKDWNLQHQPENFEGTGAVFNLEGSSVEPQAMQHTVNLDERFTGQKISRSAGEPSDNSAPATCKIRTEERGVWCTWIRLTKASPNDSYGIGVSEGISTRGIFVSAIRPNSSADRSGQLHLYDRILMVNDRLVEGLTCSEVVGHISRSEKFLDLLVQRRISRTKRFHRPQAQATQIHKPNVPRSNTLYTPGPNAGTSMSPNRVAQTNLTVI
ncbi:glutamate receptor-interacting protein 2, partial [Clonorchis sinensis]